MFWKKGRQNTEYLKFTIIQFPFFDFHILKYPEGSEIPIHIDPINNKNHYRINLILWSAKLGGIFYCENYIYNGKRLKIFRPDLYKHSVSKIISGTRYVLSIGFAKQKWIKH